MLALDSRTFFEYLVPVGEVEVADVSASGRLLFAFGVATDDEDAKDCTSRSRCLVFAVVRVRTQRTPTRTKVLYGIPLRRFSSMSLTLSGVSCVEETALGRGEGVTGSVPVMMVVDVANEGEKRKTWCRTL